MTRCTTRATVSLYARNKRWNAASSPLCARAMMSRVSSSFMRTVPEVAGFEWARPIACPPLPAGADETRSMMAVVALIPSLLLRAAIAFRKSGNSRNGHAHTRGLG